MIKISRSHPAVMNGKIVYENGVWTYSLDDIWTGIQDCYQDMAKDVKAKYDVELESVGAFGVSAMMHGYMAFQ